MSLPNMLPASQPPRMTADETRLLRQMVHEQDKTPSEVAKILQRSLGSVCRQLAKVRPTTMGRPLALSTRQVDKLIEITEAMVEEADATYEVTLPMVLRRSRLNVSEKTAMRALHKKGYRSSLSIRVKFNGHPQSIKQHWRSECGMLCSLHHCTTVVNALHTHRTRRKPTRSQRGAHTEPARSPHGAHTEPTW